MFSLAGGVARKFASHPAVRPPDFWEVQVWRRRKQKGRGPHRALELLIGVLRVSIRQRIGAKLNVDDHRLAALAAFLVPRHAVAARGPQAAAFPAAVGIVDAAVEALGVEAS